MKNLKSTLAGALLLGTSLLAPQKIPCDDIVLRLGIIPNSALIEPKNKNLCDLVLFQKINLEFGFLKNHFFIGGGMGAFELPQKNTPAPWVFYGTWNVYAALQFGDWKFGGYHESRHPVTPYSTKPIFNQDSHYTGLYGEWKKNWKICETAIQLGVIPHSALIEPGNQNFYNWVLFQKLKLQLDLFNSHFFLGGGASIFEVTQKIPPSTDIFYNTFNIFTGLQFKDCKIVGEYERIYPKSPYSAFPIFNKGNNSVSLYFEWKKKLK